MEFINIITRSLFLSYSTVYNYEACYVVDNDDGGSFTQVQNQHKRTRITRTTTKNQNEKVSTYVQTCSVSDVESIESSKVKVETLQSTVMILKVQINFLLTLVGAVEVTSSVQSPDLSAPYSGLLNNIPPTSVSDTV